MTFTPLAADLALRATRAAAGSALPGAPVVPDRAPRAPRLGGTRARSAAALHAVARWVEPHPARSPRRA